MAGVLVVKLGALGDLLLADGALRDLRAHYPAQKITLLTRHSYVSLMRRCPHVDEVIGDDNAPRWRLGRMLRLRRHLARLDVAVVHDLQNSRRSNFYRRWLLQNADWACGERASRRQAPRPVLERHAAQLEAAGVPLHWTREPNPSWIAEPLGETLSGALRPPFAVLLPGASARHPEKRWSGYADLARLLEADGYQVVSIPGPDEMDALDELPGQVLLDHGRPLSIPQLAALLPAAALVVGNDSGPTHLAALLGSRGLALFDGRLVSPRTACIEHPPRFGSVVATPLSTLAPEVVRRQLETVALSR